MHTAELLIEILTEELPAIPFLKEWHNLAPKWEQALAGVHLHAACELHYTPRRIVVYSRAFPAYTDSITQEFFGAPVEIAFVDGDRSKGLSKAGEGFCKRVGLDLSTPESIAALQSVQKDGKQVLHYRKVIEGVPSEQVLGEAVANFVYSLHFGKSMRWGDEREGSGSHGFIRPIRNIMVLLDGLPIIAKASLKDLALGNHSEAGQRGVKQGDTPPLYRPAPESKPLDSIPLDSALPESNMPESKAQAPQARGLFSQQGRAATLLHRSYAPSAQDLLESSTPTSAAFSISTSSPAPAQEPQARKIPKQASQKAGEAWVKITGLDDYLHKLEAGGVILRADEREQRILSQIKAIESRHGVQAEIDPALLAHIVAITEYPTALLGGFDERFLALPEEVVITSMKEHQKYFPLRKSGKLFHGFIVVANAICEEFSAIISGNERVLKARLRDAEFFYHNDCATPLAKEPLASIAYIDGLGSMLDKTARERTIGAYLAKAFGQNPAEAEAIDTAIALSKADLLSEMVGEFPELQGVMGYYYATKQGLSNKIAQAIKEQYLPNGEDSALPSSKLGAIVALSGKLESLLGLFSIGMIPSGSKDPYALRRAANGVARIVLEWGLDFDVRQILGDLCAECGFARENLARLQDFIIERLESILHISPLIFRSIAKGPSTSLCVMAENAKALESLLARDDREELVAVFKRVANITKDTSIDELVGAEVLEAHASKLALGDSDCSSNSGGDRGGGGFVDSGSLLAEIDTSLLTPPEAALHSKLVSLRLSTLTHPQDKLHALFSLKAELEEFFAAVLVNDENLALRRNRKLLLYVIYAQFCTIGDLKELAL